MIKSMDDSYVLLCRYRSLSYLTDQFALLPCASVLFSISACLIDELHIEHISAGLFLSVFAIVLLGFISLEQYVIDPILERAFFKEWEDWRSNGGASFDNGQRQYKIYHRIQRRSRWCVVILVIIGLALFVGETSLVYYSYIALGSRTPYLVIVGCCIFSQLFRIPVHEIAVVFSMLARNTWQ